MEEGACIMNIPGKIRIGSFDYLVEYTEHPITLDGKECYGKIDYNFHTITINNKIADVQKNEKTFLHELVHGIIHERNIVVRQEETVVEEIARGLHQVIRDNPGIFMVPEIPIALSTNP
jgi:hypothetical protein